MLDLDPHAGAHGAVRLQRRYPAPPQALWAAWTDPAALSRWFGPAGGATQAEVDLRVGGRYRIRFPGHGSEHHEVAGEYLVVEPLRRLVFSWAFHTTPERISRISIELHPVEDGTELRFVHDRFFNAEACANHGRGWPQFFDKLLDHVQSPAQNQAKHLAQEA